MKGEFKMALSNTATPIYYGKFIFLITIISFSLLLSNLQKKKNTNFHFLFAYMQKKHYLCATHSTTLLLHDLC